MERDDVIIVSSVSSIYGLGDPQEYRAQMLVLEVGQEIKRKEILAALVNIQYSRNDASFERGTFRVRGDTVEVYPAYDEQGVRIELWGDEIERISRFDPLTGDTICRHAAQRPSIRPRTSSRRSRRSSGRWWRIRAELDERLKELLGQNRLLEAQRLESRTNFDIEMMLEIGTCSGIENYSRHLTGRREGERPACLLDYFPEDFLVIVDESHVSRAADRGDVQRRPRAQADAGGARLPPPLGARQPAAQVRGVGGAGAEGGVRLRDAGRLRAGAERRRGGGADHPPDRAARPGGGGPAGARSGGRPAGRDPRPRGEAASGCW